MQASPEVGEATRFSRIDVASLDPPPRLIVNPRAGSKLGVQTNAGTVDAVVSALAEAGIRPDVQATRSPRHATELARAAVADGCKLVIAAGGDGTLAEAGEGLIGTDAALGLMPLGSIMNMGRTLCIPRDLRLAAQIVRDGQVLAMDLGMIGGHPFLEAGGVGLAAGLFGYFRRLDSGPRSWTVVAALVRFLRSLGEPRLIVFVDGQRHEVRAPMITVSNGPYVGAAYVLAPEARVDDGLLDAVIFRRTSVPRVLFHLAMVAGGRRLPPPPEAQVIRARSIRVATRRRRPLPVHADGAVVGVTPALFEIRPAALRVLVGTPTPGETCAWRRTEATG